MAGAQAEAFGDGMENLGDGGVTRLLAAAPALEGNYQLPK